MKHLISFTLALILMISCKMSGSADSNSAEAGPVTDFKNLGLTEFMTSYLKENKDSAMLLDLRTPPEFDSGYIKGAILINYLEDDIDQQLNLLVKSKRYYIYCQQGARSAKCMEKMKGLGFTNVYSLTGGYEAYLNAFFK